MILIVKCGGPAEQGKPKPGNRGKRDSQLILMNFFSRVTYNDRMTPLDYELFQKIKYITGVTPDLFEVVLMVRQYVIFKHPILKIHTIRWMRIPRCTIHHCGC